MPFFTDLAEIQKNKKSCLSVGLDPHFDKFPEGIPRDNKGIYEFCSQIINATAPYASCFKPQIAYFAAYGAEDVLQQLIRDCKKDHPNVRVVLDAKRNDIGSTAEMYAREAFERYKVDAVTVNPYMGVDSVEPFTSYKDKGVFLLCRTSNPGAELTQNVKIENGSAYYNYLAEVATTQWNNNNNIGFVVGGTAIEELADIRKRFPKTWFLVPGVGFQGGSLEEVMKNGVLESGEGLLVNSARGIIYASQGADYAEAAQKKCLEMTSQMAPYFRS